LTESYEIFQRHLKIETIQIGKKNHKKTPNLPVVAILSFLGVRTILYITILKHERPTTSPIPKNKSIYSVLDLIRKWLRQGDK